MNGTVDGREGTRLWERADKVLPGGNIYISRSARMAGEDVLPGFVRSAEGCRLVDVDGREYIDFLCGNGPNLLGYRHPEVEAEANRQAALMDLTSFFPERMVEWSERLLLWGEEFQWVIHAKNGSDTTDLAARVMRNHSRRPLIILFQNAYHGFKREFSLQYERVPDKGLENIVRLPWNDVASFEGFIDNNRQQIAGILINPVDQSPARETINITADMAASIRKAQEQSGVLVALDDVRHGFRLHPKGSHKTIGINPDLLCLGKALGNGYATAALLGKEPLRKSASQLQFTATYVFSSVAFAAAMKTMDIYERDNAFDQMMNMGKRLVDGLYAAAERHGQEIKLSGPLTMPNLLFLGENRGQRCREFCRQAALQGVIFHPSLNWFLSAAHTQVDIDEALSVAESSFGRTPRE